MSREDLLGAVERYYSGKLEAHGPTPAGVDWNSAASQELRFEQLLKLCDAGPAFSLNDYGCGYGALREALDRRGLTVDYRGFDISPSMVEEARRRNPPPARFTTRESDLQPADYAVASGIFNVRLQATDEDWARHLEDTLVRLDALGTRGFAFNVLTLWSDPDRRRADLYYADPLALVEHCRRAHSRRVALLHDYPLYEFTILVRK
jgi:SAM-dependent methyltransferase